MRKYPTRKAKNNIQEEIQRGENFFLLYVKETKNLIKTKP